MVSRGSCTIRGRDRRRDSRIAFPVQAVERTVRLIQKIGNIYTLKSIPSWAKEREIQIKLFSIDLHEHLLSEPRNKQILACAEERNVGLG